jgi:hypothetical protein
MAHFAKIGKGNIVEQVVVIHNNELLDSNGNESEQKGIEFLNKIYNDRNIVWKQTSYNSNFRKNFATIGYLYDQTRNAFLPQQPFPSWTLNEQTCNWDAPIPFPTDGNNYKWNETNLNWEIIE